MGVIAEAVRHMLAAGMAPDDVVSAISDMESAGRNVDASAERRRAADRDRKRDARLRKSAEICGEGGISAESADATPKEKRKVSPCTPSKEKTQPSKSLSLPSEAPPPLADDFDLSAAVEAYNSAAVGTEWSKVQRLNPTRRAALRRRLAECGGIDGWRSAMARARASPFLLGDNDRGWRADFDFFLQAKSFTKLMEGGYDRRDGSQRNAGQHELLGAFDRLAEHAQRMEDAGPPPGRWGT